MIKKILLSWPLLWVFGSSCVFRVFLKKVTVIFLFHETTNNPSQFHIDHNLNVDPELFRSQISLIKKHFNLITPEQLLKGDYDRPAALITFDDGSKGFFDHAAGILSEQECPGLIFLNGGPIKGEVFWSGLVTYLCNNFEEFRRLVNPNGDPKKVGVEFLYAMPSHVEEFMQSKDKTKILSEVREYYGDFMGETDLESLSNNRWVYFGNHLYNHFNSAEISFDFLEQNYMKNRRFLGRYENSVEMFSYPYGQKGTCYTIATNEKIFKMGAEAIFSAHPENFNSRGRLFHRFTIDSTFVNSKYLLGMLFYRRMINFLKGFKLGY